jgi:hypothetical protein
MLNHFIRFVNAKRLSITTKLVPTINRFPL